MIHLNSIWSFVPGEVNWSAREDTQKVPDKVNDVIIDP